MKRTKNRQTGSTRGETLVETIVSFSIVMLTLATVTTVVRFAALLNGRAAMHAASLEEACNAVETGAFGATAESSLVITFGRDDAIEIPIKVESAEPISSFRTDWGD